MIYTRELIFYVNGKILLSLQNHDERFVFIAEWYDPNASLFRRYELLFYPGDGSVEMVNKPFFPFKVSKGSEVGLGRRVGLTSVYLPLRICIYVSSSF